MIAILLICHLFVFRTGANLPGDFAEEGYEWPGQYEGTPEKIMSQLPGRYESNQNEVQYQKDGVPQ